MTLASRIWFISLWKDTNPADFGHWLQFYGVQKNLPNNTDREVCSLKFRPFLKVEISVFAIALPKSYKSFCQIMKQNHARHSFRGLKWGRFGLLAVFPIFLFIQGPWAGLKAVHRKRGNVLPWWQSNILRSSPRHTCTAPPPPHSFRQILLASLQARRGVRVGSICLRDGHQCQAPRGLRGQAGRLVWSRTVTDVSELSSGWHGTERWNRGYRGSEQIGTG